MKVFHVVPKIPPVMVVAIQLDREAELTFHATNEFWDHKEEKSSSDEHDDVCMQSKEIQRPTEWGWNKSRGRKIWELSGSAGIHGAGWGTWSDAQDSKATRVVRVHSVQTPPGHDPFPFSTCMCWADCRLLQIYAFPSCVKGGSGGDGLSIGGESVWRRPLDAPFVVTWTSQRDLDLSLLHTRWGFIWSSTSSSLYAGTDFYTVSKTQLFFSVCPMY